MKILRAAFVALLSLSLAQGASAQDITLTSHDGKIISFDRALGDVRVFADAGGRPLGIEFDGENLYVAHAYLGVQRIDRDARVETVVDEYEGTKLEYVDDLAVSADGRIFFSDASSEFGAEASGGTYEASLLDIVEPTPKTVDSLQRLDLPAGVDIEIKIQQL